MFCKQCQNYIPVDSLFCPDCGIRLGITPPSNRPWGWIAVVFVFGLIWSVVVRKEFRVQLLNLRAQVSGALNAL